MARYRQAPIDPFLALLMEKSGCTTLKDAAAKTGMPIQNIKSFADKGVSRLDTMAKLARLFDVDIQVVCDWTSKRLVESVSEADLSETA